MGFRLPSLMAVVVAATASAHGVRGRKLNRRALRSAAVLDDEQAPLVLTPTAAGRRPTRRSGHPQPRQPRRDGDGDEAATDDERAASSARCAQAKGPELDPLDPTVTGTISHKGRRRGVDPFAAVGLRNGSFILYPSLTTSFEHATNDSGRRPSTI